MNIGDQESNESARRDVATSSQLESSMNAAVDRILANKPNDMALQLLAKAKKLRLSFSNVAREVPCSRTLIGYDDCPYPDIRKRIKGLISSDSARSLAAQVERLQEEVALQNSEIEARDTAYAELVIRVSAQQRGRSPSGKPLSPKSIQERRAQMQLVAKAPAAGGSQGPG